MNINTERVAENYQMPEDFLPAEMTRDAFQEVFATIPEESMMRAGLIDVTERLLQAHSASSHARWMGFAERFGRPPAFTFVPMKRMIALSSYAAFLMHPEMSPREGVNHYVEGSVQAFLETSFFAPIISACGKDFLAFTQVLTDSTKLLYRPGVMDLEMLDRKAFRVSYEAIASEGLRFFSDGFWRGCVKHFGGRDPEVTFEVFTDMSGETTLRWS